MSCSSDMAWMTDTRAVGEQRLEEGVGEEVENPPPGSTPPVRDEEHVAELRAGRIGNDSA
jgi:hypothetical protein